MGTILGNVFKKGRTILKLTFCMWLDKLGFWDAGYKYAIYFTESRQ